MEKWIYLAIASLCVVVVNASSSRCPSTLSNCDCTSSQVSCSMRGLRLIPEDLTFDLGTTYIYFDRNDLSEIKADHFVTFLDMTHLSLRENNITTIEEGSLDHNTKLMQIDLSHNKLTCLPETLFKRTTKLQNVYLSHNQLKRIESSHFMHLTTLQDVRLNNNHLEYVGSDAFRNSPKLNRLYLEANRLEIPEKDWFAVFNNTAEKYEVYLDDNVWSCDCRMRNFYQWGINHPWFMKHDGEGVSVPQCNFPLRLRGTNLGRIPSVDDLRCEAVALTPQTDAEVEIRTTEGQLVRLSCNATGIPLPKVKILDSNGNLVTSSKGSTVYRISEVATKDAGTYNCHASGYAASGELSSVSKSIRLVVYQSPGHVATTIILSLLFVGAGVGVGAWYYRRSRRSSYAQLPQNTAYYERQDIEQTARLNAESRHIPPGGPPAPTNVSNPYHDETESGDDEDEAVLEFSKDTEFLV